MTAIDPQEALDVLREHAPALAAARGQRVYLEQFLKSKKAILMRESGAGSVAAQEVAALAHPDYIELVEALRDATEAEESERWMMVAAQARIEVWRSLEASNRAVDRGAR